MKRDPGRSEERRRSMECVRWSRFQTETSQKTEACSSFAMHTFWKSLKNECSNLSNIGHILRGGGVPPMCSHRSYSRIILLIGPASLASLPFASVRVLALSFSCSLANSLAVAQSPLPPQGGSSYESIWSSTAVRESTYGAVFYAAD